MREARAPESDEELRLFLDDATIGLRWVDPDGRILWANRAELALAGCREHEYVGHHIAEFLVEPQAAADILSRLARGEPVAAYRTRLRCHGRVHQGGADRRHRLVPRRHAGPQPLVHARHHGPAGEGRGRAASGRGDQPPAGRLPGAALPRAAGAPGNGAHLARPAPAGRVRSRRDRPRAGDHGPQRENAGAHHRGPAARLAHRRRRAHAQPRARRPARRGRERRGCGLRRGRSEGPAARLVARGEPRVVLADPGRLQQAVANLLSNAIKFTPVGGPGRRSASTPPTSRPGSASAIPERG